MKTSFILISLFSSKNINASGIKRQTIMAKERKKPSFAWHSNTKPNTEKKWEKFSGGKGGQPNKKWPDLCSFSPCLPNAVLPSPLVIRGKHRQRGTIRESRHFWSIQMKFKLEHHHNSMVAIKIFNGLDTRTKNTEHHQPMNTNLLSLILLLS